DIYKSTEKQLIDSCGEKLDADIIVAPHHGMGNSSSKAFIETVNPDITLIPSNILMDRTVYDHYEDSGSEVYVSEWDGNIMLTSDGKTIDVYTEKERDEQINN